MIAPCVIIYVNSDDGEDGGRGALILHLDFLDLSIESSLVCTKLSSNLSGVDYL